MHEEWLPNFHPVDDPAFSFAPYVRHLKGSSRYVETNSDQVPPQAPAPVCSGLTVGEAREFLAKVPNDQDNISLGGVLGKRQAKSEIPEEMLVSVNLGTGRPPKLAKRAKAREQAAVEGLMARPSTVAPQILKAPATLLL